MVSLRNLKEKLGGSLLKVRYADRKEQSICKHPRMRCPANNLKHKNKINNTFIH